MVPKEVPPPCLFLKKYRAQKKSGVTALLHCINVISPLASDIVNDIKTNGTDQSGRRNSEDPSDEQVARDTPAHG